MIFFYLGILKNLKFFKKIFKIFFIIFSILVIFPIGKNLFYYFLEKEFYEQEIPNKIDYIFVPSGGTDRIVEAIRIKNKYNLSNTKILYSTGVAYLDKNKITNKEENYTKNLILNSKIDQNDIIFLPNARNTLENFERLNSYLIKSNSKESHILLITHAFHIKRCLIFAKKHDINFFTTLNEFKFSHCRFPW